MWWLCGMAVFFLVFINILFPEYSPAQQQWNAEHCQILSSLSKNLMKHNKVMEKKALILGNLYFWNKESLCKCTLSKTTVLLKINTVKGTAGSLRFYQLFQVYWGSWIKIWLNTNLPNYTCRSGPLLQYNFWCLKFIVTLKSSGDHLPLHHLWSLSVGLLSSPASQVELLLQAAYLLIPLLAPPKSLPSLQAMEEPAWLNPKGFTCLLKQL